MKWVHDTDKYVLEGTKLSLVFNKVCSNIYARLYYGGELMHSFTSRPLKNQKMLKEALITLCESFDMNVDREVFDTDRDFAEKVRDELTMINRCCSKF